MSGKKERSVLAAYALALPFSHKVKNILV